MALLSPVLLNRVKLVFFLCNGKVATGDKRLVTGDVVSHRGEEKYKFELVLVGFQDLT